MKILHGQFISTFYITVIRSYSKKTLLIVKPMAEMLDLVLVVDEICGFYFTTEIPNDNAIHVFEFKRCLNICNVILSHILLK